MLTNPFIFNGLNINLTKYYEYGAAIKENAATFDKFITQEYGYGTFDNGMPINDFHRRIYHGLPVELKKRINPFSISEGSLYRQLDRHGMVKRAVPVTVTNRNVGNIDSKMSVLNKLYKYFFRIIGFGRYVAFVKSLRIYSLPKSHAFLVDESKITR